MLYRSHKAHLINSTIYKDLTSSHESSKQHGLLCSIPTENLTHITAYFDPPSLFALSLVNRVLYEHVNEDHTWHRAFLLKFFGILPESDIQSEKTLVLRRTESSWRREYVFRFNLTRRWEFSRNTTIAHVPVPSSISSMHLMQSNSLISSSIQYGIVSRSFPLTGKVLKGFLSPSSSGTGLGIGNPNTEFAPNVTACALTSNGGTAKIVWGCRNGEVAVMTAAKTMEMGIRSAARLIRCKVNEEHEAEVTHVEWDDTGSLFVSAARDGRIKLWDAKKVRCVWTSQYFLPALCVFLVLRSGYQGYTVASTMDSGEILLWSRITLTAEVPLSPMFGSPNVRIPNPIRDDDMSSVPTSLHVDNSSSYGAHVFVTYQSQSQFWGIIFEHTSSTCRFSKYYSDETSGAVTALSPCFGGANERGFVIAGHRLGWITIYPQANFLAPSSNDAIPLVYPTRRFEAHSDGSAVTAIAWNGIVLVTGSDLGDTSIFDACSFSRLRVLNSPLSPSRIRGIGIGAQAQAVPAGVNQILLGKERDFLVVSIGDRALAFKADVPSKYGKKKTSKTSEKKKAIKSAKGYEKVLVDQSITESLEEHNQKSQYLRKVCGREREHQENLNRLGLNEVEALEYVLMLSRDEALQRPRVGEGASQHRELDGPSGVIDDDEGDFDNIATDPPSSSRISSSSVTHVPEFPSIPHQISHSYHSLHPTGPVQSPESKAIPIAGPSNWASLPVSNQKIQIHPRGHREPREAAFREESVSSSLSSSTSGSSKRADSVSQSDEGAFPLINPSRSITDALSPSSSVGAGPTAKVNPNAQTQALASSTFAQDHGIVRGPTEDIDEDLKLAIQLSLESAKDEAQR
ncbi:hypothetical protein F5890DRAFT_1529838 [Lentinula detonsa]|uniref:F-box domain-containing protein n=1 Tax=Lentinula detonsa TaxID=2804962 RepID=A0AA38UQ80_9AGAR|nr:hypothetical protein F5890DRAFT_1529838 [Lentinula detonsa]